MIQQLPEQFNTTSFFLDENIQEGRGDRTAVYYRDERFSYTDLSTLTNRVGNALKSLGVEMEQRVYMVLQDSPEFVASFYGIQKIGAQTIVAYTYLSPDDYEFEMDLLRPKIIIADQGCMDRLRKAAQGKPYLKAFLVVGGNPREMKKGELDFHKAIESADDELEVADTHREDYARWGFTGGSTGHPKALPVPHSTLAYSFESMQHILGYTRDDIVLPVPKMFFGYGRTGTIVHPFRVGAASILFPERTTVGRIFELIEQYKPTILAQVPTMMRKMLQTPKEERTDLSCIRVCTCAGEALSAELYHEWKDTFGCEVINMLGSAEMGYVYAANRPGDIVAGSVGKPIPGYEVRIVDDNGHEVPDGETGVLTAKGPTSGFFYYRMPEESRKVFRGEWVFTGDLFKRDEQGNLWFVGRADDLLKVSGVWVSPLEIERVVQTHPDVADCAVVGVKDSDGLEKTKAFVVLKAGVKGTVELAEGLKSHTKQTLSPYKFPRFVEFLDDLPKSTVGKVDRNALKAQGI